MVLFLTFLKAASLIVTLSALRETTRNIFSQFTEPVPKSINVLVQTTQRAPVPVPVPINFQSETVPVPVSFSYNYSCGGVRGRGRWRGSGVPPQSSSRIVGGKDARRGEIPWRTVIYDLNSGGFCGGTVIDRSWVMTAAHCMRSATPEGLQVLSGVWNIFAADTESVRSGVDLIQTHPNFDPKTLDNDISLLHLETPLNWTENIHRVCLPWNSEGRNCDKSVRVLASGWGLAANNATEQPAILQKVNLPCISTSRCAPFYKAGQVTDNMLCTYLPGKDTCKGDSGGSVDYKDPETERYFAMGIVSWGPTRCGAKGKPGVYTKITNYLPWIAKTATGASFLKD